MMKQPSSQSNWERVRREAGADAPIPFEPDDGPYNPNSVAEVEQFLAETKRIRGRRGPQKAPVKEMISIRLSGDVLDYFRAGGDGWQGRINEVLGKYVKSRRH